MNSNGDCVPKTQFEKQIMKYQISIIMTFILKKTIDTYSKAKIRHERHKFLALNMC